MKHGGRQTALQLQVFLRWRQQFGEGGPQSGEWPGQRVGCGFLVQAVAGPLRVKRLVITVLAAQAIRVSDSLN
ncbi:putative hypothetical protein [Streptomyces sp. NBRC 110611]|nr:putative hypothetical protein [Streptomyces sp. NBRC 110611]